MESGFREFVRAERDEQAVKQALADLLRRSGQDPHYASSHAKRVIDDALCRSGVTSGATTRLSGAKRAELLMPVVSREAEGIVSRFRRDIQRTLGKPLNLPEGEELEMILTFLSLGAFKLGLAIPGKLDWRLAATLWAASGLTTYPPLVLQESEGASARLFYLGGPMEILRVATLEVPDAWIGRAQRDEINTKILTDLDERLSAEDRFAAYYTKVQELVGRVAPLAYLQWKTAGLLGALSGIGRIEEAWWPYARGRETDRLLGFMRSLVEKRDPAPPTWDQTVDEPDPALSMAGAALRHLVRGEHLVVPVVAQQSIEVDGAVSGIGITVNHPLIARREVNGALDEALARLKRRRARGLSESDAEFLAELQEALQEVGCDLGERVPRGFWPDFVEQWNSNRPDQHLDENHAAVKYHRLRGRLNEARPTILTFDS